MGMTYLVFRKTFSPIGLSVLGGFIHNLTQLLVAYLLIVKHLEIFYLFPILAVIGIITGFFNGWVVTFLYDYVHEQMEHLLPYQPKT